MLGQGVDFIHVIDSWLALLPVHHANPSMAATEQACARSRDRVGDYCAAHCHWLASES